VIDALLLVRLPYHLSTFTQAVARTALAHTDELLGTVDAVKRQRDRIVEELTRLGLEVVPSDANFVAFGDFVETEGRGANAHAVWQALLDRGVLVREGLLPNKLRVTAGTVEETGIFLDALREILSKEAS
jgi:histidinol-phosphate aminotransferase